MTEYPGLPLSIAEAVDWVRESLAQGSALAMLMAERLGLFSSARLLVPEAGKQQWTFLPGEHGRGYRSRDIDLLAGQFLRSLACFDLQTLLVEDDLARKGDPNLAAVAYVEDRVLRWIELGPDPARAVALLRGGSSGYPLNAFVCRRSPTQLRLRPGRQLDAEQQASIVESTEVTIVSVYDAEAYVALLSPGVRA
jgi:hypothetical protein